MFLKMMKAQRLEIKTLLLVFVFLFNSSFAFGQNADLEKAEKIKSLMKKYKLSERDFGLAASDMINRQAYYLNENQAMIPASITKLVTSFAVLKTMKAGTRVKTFLMSENLPDENGLVAGPLYFVGGGDAGFVSESLWVLVNQLVIKGVKKIKGDIVVDDSLFDQNYFDTSRENARVDRAYDAPVSALSFNWNSVNVYVLSQVKMGSSSAPIVKLDPESSWTQLKNQVRFGDKNVLDISRNSIFKKSSEASVTEKIPSGDEIIVRGKIVKGKSDTQLKFTSISHPPLWAGAHLIEFLKQRGIEVEGRVRLGVAKRDSMSILSEVESKPIEHMVTDMNKFSNNFVAEMLTKLLDVQDGTKPGSIHSGMKKIMKIVKDSLPEKQKSHFSTEVEKVQFFNPSGLTRENKATALFFLDLLKLVQSDIRLFPEFIASLPIGGVDGTLRRRFSDQHMKGWVRAKTGLLTGVYTLAGFAGNEKGNILTFAFMYNGPADGQRVREFFDEALEVLLK